MLSFFEAARLGWQVLIALANVDVGALATAEVFVPCCLLRQQKKYGIL